MNLIRQHCSPKVQDPLSDALQVRHAVLHVPAAVRRCGRAAPDPKARMVSIPSVGSPDTGGSRHTMMAVGVPAGYAHALVLRGRPPPHCGRAESQAGLACSAAHAKLPDCASSAACQHVTILAGGTSTGNRQRGNRPADDLVAAGNSVGASPLSRQGRDFWAPSWASKCGRFTHDRLP